MIYEGKDFSADVQESAEVVVIGSGAGGPVVAKELAEKGRSVVMVEEGPKVETKDFNRDPFHTFRHFYRDGGATVALGRPAVPFPLGRCLGGTTTVNSGTCFRTPDKILRKWRREIGLEGIEPERMRPYFERVEKMIDANRVTPDILGRNGEIVLRGAKQLGYSSGPLTRNMRGCRGCGVCTLGCPSGGKRATFLNYIPRASHFGAKVYCDTRVSKLVVKNGAAVGVEGAILDRDSGKPRLKFSVSAKLVVLAAGAVYSPLLLLKNKLANGSGQVGKNLRLHPGIRVYALMDEVVDGWRGVPQAVFVDEFADEGVMLEGIFVGPVLTGPVLPYFGERNKELMFKYQNLAAHAGMISDETRGRVRLGLLGRPLITYQMLPEDVKKGVKAIAYTAEIFFAAGAKKIYPTVSWMPEMNSPRQVRELLSGRVKGPDLEFMAFHPMGTCRMGADRRDSVVDPYGESWEIKNLFVCDASIFPSCLGVNPMESIMAFANRSADYMQEMKLKG